ncbi:MAG: ferrous iron transport protein B [Clostridiales bacterium]|nr:ferrous iron transport protein B [Clostridiales bacterium]
MDIKIALAGNPNCGKTTLFNALTGSNQYVGNWPGVTVEKKEGKLKGHKDVVIQDLPGIYSLSPYTLEEVVARNYLVKEQPDAILNIVDGTNIERNLYLTTQLIELGLPVVVAVNMIDLVRKNGDKIDLTKLGKALGCEVVEMSALKGEGGVEAAEKAIALAQAHKAGELPHVFTGSVEHAIAHIEESIQGKVSDRYLRWYAIKVFERDEKVMEELNFGPDLKAHLEEHIVDCEKELDDDAESIITNQRYAYISGVVHKAVVKKAAKHSLTVSDKIDQVVTNRIAALPIFACVMFLIYAIAMGPWKVSIGTALTDWANDGLFGDGWLVPFVSDVDGWDDASGAFEEAEAIIEAYEAGDTEVYFYDDETGDTDVVDVNEDAYNEALAVEEPDPADYGVWVPGIPALIEGALDAMGCNDGVKSLVLDGIVGGVGAVLGFVPQMLVLFLLLAILEDVGYMARIAFIMDRIFRRFGLSGKSFIPMLVATGCGVPGVMASRTIEQDRDRKMTIMTTCFIPCGAKMPIIAMFAGALFGKSVWVAVSAYFIGVAAVVISGIMLKKFKAFAGEPAPFVMELPSYHAPSATNVLRATWERGWSFIKRAGTVILLSSIILWFLNGFGFTDGAFGMVEDANDSILAAIGNLVAWIFAPLGFGSWQAAVATITGLVAKEEVVSTFGVLYPGNLSVNVAQAYTAVAAYSFMVFNLLCAPCFAAMGAIKREMNNAKWTWAAIGYMCLFAYVIALIVYQIGGLIAGVVSFNLFTVVAVALLAGLLFLLFRPASKLSDVAAVRSTEVGKV